MPETLQPVGSPPVPKAESLKAFKKEAILATAKSLYERLNVASPDALIKSPKQDRQELEYLKRLVKVDRYGRLDLRGHHNVAIAGSASDPDKLWIATNVLYPKAEAETAYYIIQAAQIASMGGTVGEMDARRIHQELLKPESQSVLARLNQRQILYGDNASLKILAQQVDILRYKKEAKGAARRRFLRIATLGAAALGAKMISDKLPARVVNSPLATPTAEVASKLPDNLFTELIKPFIEEAMIRRKAWEKADPEEYNRIIDKEINENRINVVVFGYGEEHGETYEDYGGAPSVLSLDLKTGKIAVIHFSRDIRVLELEEQVPERERKPMVLRSVYKTGGYDKMRNVIGRMSGLVADYQLVMKDVVLRNAIALFGEGSLEIDVSKDHDTGPFRLDRVQYGDGFIKKGRQLMDTRQLMRYVLAEDKDPQGKEDERSYRKNQVTEALIQKVRDQVKGKSLPDKLGFLYQVKDFVDSEVNNKNLELEFDSSLILKAIKGVVGSVGKFLGNLGQNIEFTIPEIDKKREVVFHDQFFGDGGVTRVHNLINYPNEGRTDNPKVLEEVQAKLMPEWMLIPDGGNPYSTDLVRDYWFSVRKMVKACLLTP